MPRFFARNRIVGVKNFSILLLGLYACGADTALGPEDQGPEQLQVDAGGTTVSAQNGNVSLTVPEGAVAAATTITVIRVSEEPADPGLIPGTLYDFGPDGLQFAEPVTLRLAYDPTALPDEATEERLRIFKRAGSDGTFTPNGADWLPTANGSVDVSTATVTGDINGFSQYGIVFFPLLEVSTASVPFGVEGVNYWEVNGGGDHLSATGGDGNYSWTVVAGELPAGLILAGTGSFEGISTTVGTTDATLQVTSGDGQAAQQAFSITVRPRPILAPSELCTDYPGYAIATFADVNLDTAAKAAVGLGPADPLSCEDAAGVQFLLGTDAGITTLVGIQNLPNLLELSLGENPLLDISALRTSDLPLLRGIRLYSNSLTDLSALDGLASLAYVDVSDNAITDLSALRGLTSLTFLSVNDNFVTDLTPLGGLTSLIGLELKNNSITDVGPLSGLTSLADLRLSDNLVQVAIPLGGLTSLVFLQLDNNRLGAFSIGIGMTELATLDLSGNSIDGEWFDPLTPYRSPIGGIQSLVGLEHLDLTNTPIGTFEPVLAFAPLLANAGLGAGDSVQLGETLVACSVVDDLRAKGVSVSLGTSSGKPCY